VDLQDITEKVSDFAQTTNGKIILGVGGLVGVVAVVATIRKNQRSTPATAGSNIPVGAVQAAQPGTAGSATDAVTAQIQAQAKAQTDLIAAQTQAAKETALFQLDINQKANQQALANETAVFDAKYSGLDSSILSIAGIDRINTTTGQALTQVAPGTRTARIPSDASGLTGGLPSVAGQSVLESIADALGLGLANGESRAGVLARLNNFQNQEATRQAILQQQAATADYTARLTSQYQLQSDLQQSQYEQAAKLQEQQARAQERASNPFLNLGTTVKTLGGLFTGGLFRSTKQPVETVIVPPSGSVATPPFNPGNTSIVGQNGGYALLEPVYRQVQQTGTFIGFA
jgi:hypothetical protein